MLMLPHFANGGFNGNLHMHAHLQVSGKMHVTWWVLFAPEWLVHLVQVPLFTAVIASRVSTVNLTTPFALTGGCNTQLACTYQQPYLCCPGSLCQDSLCH